MRVASQGPLGGVFPLPEADVPTVGRFAVIADPQGASIAISKPASAMQAHDTQSLRRCHRRHPGSPVKPVLAQA